MDLKERGEARDGRTGSGRTEARDGGEEQVGFHDGRGWGDRRSEGQAATSKAAGWVGGALLVAANAYELTLGAGGRERGGRPGRPARTRPTGRT